METIEQLKQQLEQEKQARLRAEEMLASALQRQRFYEDVLNSLPADIVVLGMDHTYLFLNPVGIKDPALREWMIGKNDEEYCIKRNRPLSVAYKRRELFNYVTATKKMHYWEEKLITPEGNFEHHLRHMYPVLDQEGEIMFVVAFGFNITDRKKIEEQLKVTEKRHRDLFNYSPAFICTHDLKGKLLSVNPALCEMLGYTSDELVGKTLPDFIPEHDMQQFLPAYMDYVLKDGHASGIFTVVHKSGKEKYLLYRNYKVEEENSEPYIIGFSQDITGSIRAEKDAPLYDLTMVESVGKDSPGFTEKMVGIFLETFPADLNMLVAASEAGNWESVAKTAHKMKSTIDGMGIVSLKQTIKNLEAAARQKDAALAAGLVKNVEKVISAVIAQLHKNFP